MHRIITNTGRLGVATTVIACLLFAGCGSDSDDGAATEPDVSALAATDDSADPAAPAETVEIVAFIEAANRSGANHGSLEMLKV